MATDKRLGTKIASFTDKDTVPGYKRDAGPYIGVVKNNADPARAGRLQVYIPDFGGDETEPTHWVTVGYANPYMGAARTPVVEVPRSPANSYETVNHSYGMWFTPPDIGNHVLITFVSGDVNHGYWFACVNPDLSHWAIPGQAGAENLETPLDTNLSQALTTPPYPSVEFNESNSSLQSRLGSFLKIQKPVHVDQVATLLNQGLEDDKVRGVISSSSQRESPSKVFGISTPGRDGPNKDHITGQVTTRLGGHTFVMDDGDKAGIDQLVRLRTAGGHQILMNDTQDILYISNKAGTVWFEFTGDGKTNLYSESDINIRTKSNINFHADKDINMYSGNNINMYAVNLLKQQTQTFNLIANLDLEIYGQKIGVKSGSTMGLHSAGNFNTKSDANYILSAGSNLTAKSGANMNLDSGAIGSFLAASDLLYTGSTIQLNGPAAPSATNASAVIKPAEIPVVQHKETVATMYGKYPKWKTTAQVNTTIPTSYPIPTHEPYALHPSGPAAGGFTTTPGSSAPITSIPIDTSPAAITPIPAGVNQPGPINAQTKGLSNKQLSTSDLAAKLTTGTAPKNQDGIGSLTPAQVTALKAQLAHTESNFNYSSVNSIGFIGKYQFGYLALIDRGYVNSDVTSNAQLNSPLAWTGHNGILTITDFFNSPDVQESIMDDTLAANNTHLTNLGTIDSSSPAADIAGKLAVSHLLGAGGCNKWAKGLGGKDQYGTDGDTYYNLGQYAVTVLSTKIG